MASASTAAAAIAKRVGLRMLCVICTPKLTQDAADLADRAAGAQRLAHRRQEVWPGTRAAPRDSGAGGWPRTAPRREPPRGPTPRGRGLALREPGRCVRAGAPRS